MDFRQNQIYHIYNQGNNKQEVFFQEENYIYFFKKMRLYLLPYVDILCYCLMPNHFHFLVFVKNVEVKLENGKHRNLNFSIGLMLRSYTQAINKQEKRSGALFRAHTKAKDGWIDEFITINSKNKQLFFRPDNNYARQCFEYIHQNPVKAKLTKYQVEWNYSSARDYAGERAGTLCNQKLAKDLLF